MYMGHRVALVHLSEWHMDTIGCNFHCVAILQKWVDNRPPIGRWH